MAGIKSVSSLTTTRVGTAIPDVPDSPIIGTATKITTNASVAFTPAATGGTATSYTASSYIAGVLTSPLKSGTGTTSPITISGLTSGTTYTFTVSATNSTASSSSSAASNSVTM